jgi:hypothetical protein
MEFMGLRGEEEKNELHRFWCGEYFGWTEGGALRDRKPVRSTTKNEQGQRDEISVDTALDFYGFIQKRAADQGVFVPDPHPFWREARAA